MSCSIGSDGREVLDHGIVLKLEESEDKKNNATRCGLYFDAKVNTVSLLGWLSTACIFVDGSCCSLVAIYAFIGARKSNSTDNVNFLLF